ncbi:MAG: C25 family cysteine peptidase [bacterium]
MKTKKTNILFWAVLINLITLPVFGEDVLTKFDALNSFIACKVDIEPLKIKSINGYDIVEVRECHQSAEIGRPKLPVRSFFVLLPPEAVVKDITITSIEQIELKGEYNICPVSPPIPISNGSKTAHPQYLSLDFYPENIIKLNSIQKLRGYNLACLSVFGACYNPETKQLFWNKQINFNLNLTKTEDQRLKTKDQRLVEEDEKLVKELVVNPEVTTSYGLKMIRLQPTYTYCIITSETLADTFKPLLEFKINQRGFTGTITTTNWIYANYQGDEQEKIKAFIKDYYENYGTCYVLLGGDAEVIPYRGVYAKVPEGSNLGDYIDSHIPCDLYYACFDNDWDWDTDEDRIYGELNEDNIDLMPEIFIGRAPVSNLSEVTNFVNKVISYETSDDDYFYNELLIAYKLWYNPVCDAKEIMEDIAMETPGTYTIHKEYETDGGVDKNGITNDINSGVGPIAHANHANWNTAPPFEIGSPIDVRTLSNGSKTFIFNTIGCIAGDFSKADCIGEEMILNSNGGAVAFVGNSRYGWFDEYNVKKYSGEYQIEFFKKIFEEGYTRIGETLSRSKVEFISRCNDHNPYRWIMFCLNLLGEPTMEFEAVKEIFCIDYTIKDVIDKPGTITDLIVTLKNIKDGTITGGRGTLTTTDPNISIVKGTATFGDMPSKGTSTNFSNPYQIMVNSNCPSVHKVEFNLEISGQDGQENYKYTDRFSVTINLKEDNLSRVIHYPNPCYPDEGDVLKIGNIPLNSNPKIYIYNLAGELIRTLDEEGIEIQKYPGSEVVYWDAKNDLNKDVAFGVYIYILKCDVGTKKGKIAIIR